MASRSNAQVECPTPLKKQKRDCKYQLEWKQSGISQSKRGPSFARCDVCNCDFSIAHGGANDVKRHLITAKHQEMGKVVQSKFDYVYTPIIHRRSSN